MALKTLENFYKTTVSTSWGTGTGNRYVSTLPSPSAGFLVINPSNVSKREIVSYSGKGTDGGGNYITLTARGLGGTSDQTHAVGEAVRMNFVAGHYADIQTELDAKLDDSQLDTDGTLSANSDAKVASQKAVKTYVDTEVASVESGLSGKVGLTGDETVAGIKTFSSSPIVPAPTTDFQAATKKYADDLSFAGAPDASTTQKGIVEEATAAQITAGTATGETGARLFVNPTHVATTGVEKIIRTNSGGLLESSIIPFVAPTFTGTIRSNVGATPFPVTQHTSGSIIKSSGAISSNAKFVGFASATTDANIFPAVVTQTTAAINSTSQSFDFAAADDRMIVVIVGSNASGSGSVSAVTFGATNLTQLNSSTQTSSYITTWYAVLGSSGSTDTRTVTVTESLSGDHRFMILGFKNVDQSTPFDVNGTAQVNQGTSASITVSPTIASTYALFSFTYGNSASSITPVWGDGMSTVYSTDYGGNTNFYVGAGEWPAIGSNAFDVSWTTNRDTASSLGIIKGMTATATVTVGGVLGGFSGLTIGSLYYVSNTLGSIASSAGSTSVIVGKAISATQVVIVQSNP